MVPGCGREEFLLRPHRNIAKERGKVAGTWARHEERPFSADAAATAPTYNLPEAGRWEPRGPGPPPPEAEAMSPRAHSSLPCNSRSSGCHSYDAKTKKAE